MEVDEGHDKQGLMTTLQNLFTTTNPAVKKLMGWRQGDEDKWAERAIESLVKRLKKKRGALEELERAVSNPHCPSKCVTIARSLDGRIQVSHRKGHPHVMYCKLWRWPDLQSHHELRPLEHCRFPFSARHSEICINPYHYRRVEKPKLPAVLVPKRRLGATPLSSAVSPLSSMENARTAVSQNVTLRAQDNAYAKPEFTPEPMVCDATNTNSVNFNTPNDYFNAASVNYNAPNFNPANVDYNSPGVNYSNSPSVNCNSSPSVNYSNSPCVNYSNSPSVNCSNSPSINYNNSQSINYSNTTSMDYSNPTSMSCSNPAGMDYSTTNINEAAYANYDMQNVTPIAYEEPGFWASIAYYELNSRVGQIFNCSQPVVTVDGFTDPTREAGRFCLGTMSNVNRNSSIENTRRHIGRGVQLHYAAGQVYVECISEQAIFVQSRNCNYEGGLHPTTVIKVPSGSVLKIFDNVLFSNILSRSVQYGFEAIYELTKMCTVRMSFVKGWGAEYHRHDVTATPCWIEIHLNGPLRWLDNVLTGMGAPHNAISSVS